MTSTIDAALERIGKYNSGEYDPLANQYGLTGEGGTDANFDRLFADLGTVSTYIRATYETIRVAAQAVSGGAPPFVNPAFTGVASIGSRWSGFGTLGLGETMLLSPASATAAGETVKMAVASSGAGDGSPNVLVAGVDGPSLGGVAFLDTASAGVASPTPLDLRAAGTRRVRLASGRPIEVTGGASFGGWTHASLVAGLTTDTTSSIGACVVLGSETGTGPFVGAVHNIPTALTLGANGAACVRVSSNALYPAADGGATIGTASFRVGTIYSVTGTINTSDGREKVIRGPLTDAEARVARRLSSMITVFQWHHSVAEKGTDGARLHAGWIAQDVADAFRAEGLDPARYALWCADPEMEEVEVSEEVQVPATEQRVVPVQSFAVRDGRAVLVTREEVQNVPIMDDLPVFNEAGEAVVDGDGKQLIHTVPRTVTQVEQRRVLRPVTDADGFPVMRFGLRHDQLMAFVLAGMSQS